MGVAWVMQAARRTHEIHGRPMAIFESWAGMCSIWDFRPPRPPTNLRLPPANFRPAPGGTSNPSSSVWVRQTCWQTSTQYGIFKTWMLTWHSGSLGKTSQTYGRALDILRGGAGMSLHKGLLIHDCALGKIVFAPGTPLMY